MTAAHDSRGPSRGAPGQRLKRHSSTPFPECISKFTSLSLTLLQRQFLRPPANVQQHFIHCNLTNPHPTRLLGPCLTDSLDPAYIQPKDIQPPCDRVLLLKTTLGVIGVSRCGKCRVEGCFGAPEVVFSSEMRGLEVIQVPLLAACDIYSRGTKYFVRL